MTSVDERAPDYLDPALTVEERVADLLERMTLEEKAGLMFHQMVEIGEGGALAGASSQYRLPPTLEMIGQNHLTHFNVVGSADPATMARWHNRLQEAAAATRLGIPVTLSTDPRHAFTDNPGTSFTAGYFSQWPEPLGLAAIGDERTVREFADIARQEYLAVGIRVALHPQVDLATEPRWARINGTFGEDVGLTCRMLAAYIRGFQTDRLGPSSVATMTKHFPGGGPQKDGEDAHFPYGREQVYPGNNFEHHLRPFEAAFEAGTSQVMPYYGMPVGTDHEEVGFGFNKGVITGLLREKCGFDGIVCADWSLINDSTVWGERHAARAWGLEDRTPLERLERALLAGVDQFGGEHCTELVVRLVESGRIPMSRIDESAQRLLREKFVLGLFDDPLVDPSQAESVVSAREFVEAGYDAQCRSITVLTNGGDSPVLPVPGRPRLYAPGIDGAASEYADLVDDLADADLALLRVKAPFERRSGKFEQFFRAGSLEFSQHERDDILNVCRQVPTIVDIYLDRPAVIPELLGEAAAVIANYGASDRAVLDVLFGHRRPEGTLPFDLPSSMEAVAESRSDVPFDTDAPTFSFGHGLRIPTA
ncbi:glycoside hydrolase family 3 protein [Saccharopolyspora mangrovi]|uniref:beta-glucosidase n=1 Tax=Saccharopolyspora mangrovi TaxID=3082379 RepID=A0ABU6AJJ6_9PSEU|nr:glycoside hydrolase family 3 N-terminal domain-containing protein [Saccharopolyspora sp. S2-29]MEB3371727.1 glycoside hydrolase family 3 N-terminal domain-containing protein [Saccharopolyspora sp. S2-29]